MGFRKGVQVRMLETGDQVCRVGLEDQEISLVPWIASYIYVGEE
jgi:hypothetical protein